jgi:preprotein translocase subunit YajC
MENKEFYYLDGADKKGPYSKQEIIDLGLSSDTLIFFDELNKWVPYQDLEDFKPIIEEIEVESNPLQNKKKLNITNFLVLLFLILSVSGIAYFLTEEHKKKDFQKLEEKVNDIFAGKEEICDYTNSGVKGELIKPSDYFYFDKKDNEDNELYEFYSLESGGWSVYTLKKLNYGYDLIKNSSTNMGFKVPESTYRAGTDYGYDISTPGYSIPTYRGSVQNAYNEAMEYISVKKEDKSYVAGSYNRIISFNELYSDLHYIDNIHPTKYTSASVNSKSWESIGESYVFNKNWIVWYNENGSHFEIVLDKDKYLKKLLINLGTGIVIAILAFILWKYSLKNRKNIKPNAQQRV